MLGEVVEDPAGETSEGDGETPFVGVRVFGSGPRRIGGGGGGGVRGEVGNLGRLGWGGEGWGEGGLGAKEREGGPRSPLLVPPFIAIPMALKIRRGA